MKKIAVILMVITVLSKMLGFLRDITLSFFYGASATSDAYIISITITSVLFSLIFTGISTGYIPLFKQIENEVGEVSTKRFTNNLVNIIIIIATILVICGFIFSESLVKLFALGFDQQTMEIAVLFTRIGLIGIYFSSLTQLFSSHLQLNNKFAITAMIGFPFNLLIIISIFISAKTDVVVLAIGTVIASVSQLLFLLPALYKTNFRYEPFLNFKDKNMKRMAFYAFPIMIGMSIDNVNLMVDRTLASRIIEGGISSLTYASRLNDFVHGIFVLSFVTVLFPFITKMAVSNNIEGFKKSINDVISSVMILVIPASIGIMVLAVPIIRLLFGRGNFDEQAIILTSQALFFYSIGMVGYGVREVFLRSFYSLHDMKTPMYNASIAVVLNIILNLVLSPIMGISGLAFATSISALFSTVLLYVSLRRKIGPFGLRSITISFLKIIFASSAMGLCIYVLNGSTWMASNTLLKMGGNVFVGCSVYFILLTLLKVEESKIIIGILRKKVRL